MSDKTNIRRRILKGALAAGATGVAPFLNLKYALGADAPIKIGIPTVITGGYAILGSQVMRTCKLVQKMVNAKNGVAGRKVEFLFQDTQGDPAQCVRKVQELVERDNCHLITGVCVSSEAV